MSVRDQRLELRLSVQESKRYAAQAENLGVSLSAFARLAMEHLSSDFETNKEDAANVKRAVEGTDCPFTPVQLSTRLGIPVATAKQHIDRGTWAKLL